MIAAGALVLPAGLFASPCAWARPSWLLLALLAIPCAWIAWRWFGSMAGARRASAAVTRAVLLGLMAAALAGASAERDARSVGVVAVVDLSESVTRGASLGLDDAGEPIAVRDAVRSFLARGETAREPDDRLGVVVAGERAVVAQAPTRVSDLAPSLTPAGSAATDLASALELATAVVPGDATGRVVLFSDGNETAGDVLAVAEASARSGQGVRIDVVPITLGSSAEVAVVGLDAPPRASDASPVLLRVTLSATAPARGTLRLTREGVPIDINGAAAGTGRPLALDAGRRVETVRFELPPGRVHRFEAVFEPELDTQGRALADGSTQNNRASAFTITPGRGRVLVVDGVGFGRPDSGGRVLARTLADAGLDVEVRPPLDVPADLLSLEAFDLVILENVPIDELPPDAEFAIASAVCELGVGLVMLGGPDSFGPGGWTGSRVAEVLPVHLDLPDTIVSPEAAVVFVLDSSGSMSRTVLGSPQSQQQVANESAAGAVDVLEETDLVGAISFDNAARVVVPLTENTDPERTKSAIRSIASGGGTNLGPAMELAREQLEGADAKSKHVIVLSDGQSQAPGSLPEIAAQMAREGISVTTIAVGDDADAETMLAVATEGNGAFYNVTNPAVLPRVFLKAVRVVRSPLVRERAFVPVVRPGSAGLAAGVVDPPELLGLTLTRAREEPTVSTEIFSDEGEPVLASWPVELGRVTAFTSDAHRWGEPWIDWPGYRDFWVGLARRTARTQRTDGPELLATLEGDTLALRLDAFGDEGEPLDGLAVPASVFLPGGDRVEITLAQTAAGRYEAALPLPPGQGPVIAVARPQASGEPLPPALTGVTRAPGAELGATGTNLPALRAIAEATGGRVISIDDPLGGSLFTREGLELRRAITPLWPVLLAWAMAAFLLDVATRRIAWDRLLGIGESIALERALSGRGVAAAGTLSGLRSSRGGRDDAPSDTALTERDAGLAAVRAARERERADQVRVRAKRASKRADNVQPTERSPKPEAEPESGLLAAKRRATRKYDEE